MEKHIHWQGSRYSKEEVQALCSLLALTVPVGIHVLYFEQAIVSWFDDSELPLSRFILTFSATRPFVSLGKNYE